MLTSKIFKHVCLFVILFTTIFFISFCLQTNIIDAYYSPYFFPPWPQAPFFNPIFPGPFSAGYFYPRSSQSNTNFASPFYPPFMRWGFSTPAPYFFPQQPSLPFYIPAAPASLLTIYNPSLTNTYLRPDPQWRTGREAIPSPPTSPGFGTGLDTGEIRIYPPASRGLGVTYDRVIPGYVNRQLIVMFRPEAPPQDRAGVLAKHNATEIRTSPHAGFTLVALPTMLSVLDAMERFNMEPAVIYAEPNYYRHAHLIPNDPYYRYQWHLPHMNTNWAWDLNTGTGVTIGLLDSGVSYRNAAPYALAPDLAGTLILAGWDFVNADANPDDDAGHGTHMCGCIAQTTNNLLGVAGVAFSSTVMAVKVMDSVGNVTIADEADGIYYAANNGAHIINLSLGGTGTSVTEQTAVIYAYNLGILTFGSSGNAGSTVPEYPASYPECVSVGAVQYDRTRPSYSNYGAELDLVAPGGNITLDQNLDGYADGILQQTHDGTTFSSFFYYFMEGTSPACALVSGVAALVLSKSTAALTPLQLRNILESTAIDLGIAGWDQEYGWGEVDAYSAVLSAP